MSVFSRLEGETDVGKICPMINVKHNGSGRHSEYCDDTRRRLEAEADQDCVVLPTDTGFAAAYADVKLDIKQSRGRNFAHAYPVEFFVKATALVDSVCVSLEFARRLGFSAEQFTSESVPPKVYSAEGNGIKILGRLPVELFAIQFGEQGDFFGTRP